MKSAVRSVRLTSVNIDGADNMSGCYINRVYPYSNRIRSRPFDPWHHESNEKPSIHAFYTSLCKIGEDLIGEPFEGNLDIDAAQEKPFFTPASWDAERVFNFSQTEEYKALIDNMPADVAKAFDIIVAAVRPYRGHFVENVYIDNKNQPYSYFSVDLTDAFKTVWAHDWMLDARLIKAEAIFASRLELNQIKDGSLQSRQIPNVKASLEWMMVPSNADRIAHAFLYSRLSQHFGETDPRSVDLAACTHAKLKAGKTEDALIHEVKAEAGLSGFFITAVGPRFSNLFGIKRPENARGLWKSLPSMYVDHARLLDGSWARSQLEQIVLPAMSRHAAKLENAPK